MNEINNVGSQRTLWEMEEEELGKNSTEWFKPEQGSYKIVILGEPKKKTFTDSQTGEVKEQMELQIEVDKKAFTWTIGKGLTVASLYGQILKLAHAKDWQWAGLTFTLGVKLAGKMPNGNPKRDYFIS